MSITFEPCITPEEAADEIRVHIGTIRRLLREGVIKGFRVGNGPRSHWRIPLSAWEEFKRGIVRNVIN